MQKNEAGHRSITPASTKRLAVLTKRWGILQRVVEQTPAELVDDVIVGLRAEYRENAQRLAEVDRADHKAKQYAMCSECREKITVADLQANECFNCGSKILSKGKV